MLAKINKKSGEKIPFQKRSGDSRNNDNNNDRHSRRATLQNRDHFKMGVAWSTDTITS